MKYLIALVFSAAGFLPFVTSAAAQGVTDTQILVASIQDLSGPVASYGKDFRNGMLLRFGELNEQGGVHGRKVKLLVEDSGYDPKRAVLAAQKLLNQDGVFLVMASSGSAVNRAVLPLLEEKEVMNFFPMALGREMYEPVSDFKFAMMPSYFEQMARMVPILYVDKKATTPCILYQDDDLGLEVMRGAEAGLKTVKAEFVERTSYKRGATDFSSQMAKLKASKCDFVVLATTLRETVGSVAEARKIGFDPTLITANPGYTDMVAKLGGKPMDGLYAVMTAQQPYPDDQSDALRRWASKYQATFNEAPSVHSTYGYSIADALVSYLQKAGRDLTTKTLARAIEATKIPVDIFGGPELVFTPNNHLGTVESRISELKDGRWIVVVDYQKSK